MTDPDIAAVRDYVRLRGYTSGTEGWAVEIDNGPTLAALARVEARLEAAEKALTEIADEWEGQMGSGDMLSAFARRALAGKDAAA